ncbi:hypothetical protein B0H11DRAFT_1960453 [Mycena galericulata]|nr:hypothetical protein B0H11DRAFT_1960453 [Mycena galericulata]
MTAAVYRGREGEEEWRRELQTYSGIRHPNIVQVYGAVNSSDLSATIFHDELIPLRQYYDLYKDSPLIYIYVKYWKMEFLDAFRYLVTHGISPMSYASWIRQSTGSLVVDVLRSSQKRIPIPAIFQATPYIPIPRPCFNVESTMVSSLSFLDFYGILATYLDRRRFHMTPKSRSIALGAFVHFPRDNPAQFVELASVPSPGIYDGGWNHLGRNGVAMQNGWTRFQCSEFSGIAVSRNFRASEHDMHVLFSQAGHILSSLNITSNYEEYRWTQALYFHLPLKKHLPDGYLFLCPSNDLKTPGDGFFQITDCQAYWSLEASGIQKLSAEEAVSLGFPAPVLQVQLISENLGEYEYGTLRKFHQAKGFDPDSQDVARHLGYPLYQICGHPAPPFTHVEEEFSDPDAATTQMTTEHGIREFDSAPPNGPGFFNHTSFMVLGALGVVIALVLSLPHFRT